MLWWLILLWCAMMSWVYLQKRDRRHLLFSSMDADMKIAPDYSSKNKRNMSETPDQSSQELLEQKQNGNLDKARTLGYRWRTSC